MYDNSDVCVCATFVCVCFCTQIERNKVALMLSSNITIAIQSYNQCQVQLPVLSLTLIHNHSPLQACADTHSLEYVHTQTLYRSLFTQLLPCAMLDRDLIFSDSVNFEVENVFCPNVEISHTHNYSVILLISNPCRWHRTRSTLPLSHNRSEWYLHHTCFLGFRLSLPCVWAAFISKFLPV